ncbi:MAG: hypothetical protein LBT99_00290 [Bifidobacteriaceae bacterium]|jgi:hypothetical protein|nr:hypothetical protein [Bifidobacteriaceae bacterium]
MTVLSLREINREKLYNTHLKSGISLYKTGKNSLLVGYKNNSGIKFNNLTNIEQEYLESLFFNSSSKTIRRQLLKKLKKNRFRYIENILNTAGFISKTNENSDSKTTLSDKTIAITSADKFGANLITALVEAGCKKIILLDNGNVLSSDIGPVFCKDNVGLPRLEIIKKYLNVRYSDIRLTKPSAKYIDLFIVINRFNFNFDFSKKLKFNNIDHLFINLQDNQSYISPIITYENNLCLFCHSPKLKYSLFTNKIGYKLRDNVYFTSEKIYTLTGFIASQIKIYFTNLTPDIDKAFTHFSDNGSSVKINKVNQQKMCLCQSHISHQL